MLTCNSLSADASEFAHDPPATQCEMQSSPLPGSKLSGNAMGIPPGGVRTGVVLLCISWRLLQWYKNATISSLIADLLRLPPVQSPFTQRTNHDPYLQLEPLNFRSITVVRPNSRLCDDRPSSGTYTGPDVLLCDFLVVSSLCRTT